jgi:hypothetical protein
MKVIGSGVGRTGTYSLKKALERLGLGPCHHMEEVTLHMAEQVPLWAAAAEGRPDWDAIYKGYESAVDWPTARFSRELAAAYPSARFILTVRDPERWVESYWETVVKIMSMGPQFPPEDQGLVSMAERVMADTGFPAGLSRPELLEAFQAHIKAVKAAIPGDQLLVFDVREGWEPLCEFLGLPIPDEPFPRTNNRTEYWEHFPGPLPASPVGG